MVYAQLNDATYSLFPSLLGILGLLALNALLTACEISLIRLRYSHFNPQLLERLRQNKQLSGLIDRADSTVMVVRLGMTVCLLGYGLMLFPLLKDLFNWLELAGWGEPTVLSAIMAFLLAVGLYYVIGEMVPRGLGIYYPVQALQASSRAVKLVYFCTNPILRLLTPIVKKILRLFNVEEAADLESLDIEAQIEMLGKEGLDRSAVAQTILKNAIQMRELVVQDILLPRHQVQWFDLTEDNVTNFEMGRNSGHTRFPLCEGDLDHCLGLIHIKDIFRSSIGLEKLDLRKIKREILRIDLAEPLEVTLPKLLRNRSHMALVIDDFGGTIGIVTLERILEQLVGEIQDEFDVEEALIKPIGDKEYLVSGLTPIHDLEEILDVTIGNEQVSTFGGLITAELGRIPKKREKLCIEHMNICVTEVDQKRIIRAVVRVLDK